MDRDIITSRALAKHLGETDVLVVKRSEEGRPLGRGTLGFDGEGNYFVENEEKRLMIGLGDAVGIQYDNVSGECRSQLVYTYTEIPRGFIEEERMFNHLDEDVILNMVDKSLQIRGSLDTNSNGDYVVRREGRNFLISDDDTLGILPHGSFEYAGGVRFYVVGDI
tara:strand:- start:836 stop:1330 length:495 start_codon:yes stop_codon:yes gene_type:complete